MINKVFLVSSGDYSDYKVVAVFSERGLAEDFCGRFGGFVEERLLNPEVLPRPEGTGCFHLTIFGDHRKPFKTYCMTKREWIWITEPPMIEAREIGGECLVSDEDMQSCPALGLGAIRPIYDHWETHVWARDEQHALKIGSEYRARLMTGNLAYEPVPGVA